MGRAKNPGVGIGQGDRHDAWHKDHDAFLRKYFKKMKYKILCEKLMLIEPIIPRTPNAVRQRCLKLGLIKNRPQTQNIRYEDAPKTAISHPSPGVTVHKLL